MEDKEARLLAEAIREAGGRAEPRDVLDVANAYIDFAERHDWQPISKVGDAEVIIGWCTFSLGAEARQCWRDGDVWLADHVVQTVTHFKPWPIEPPSSLRH